MRIRSRLNRLTKAIGPGPRIAAAVVEGASGRVLQVLRGPGRFEPAPEGLSIAELPRGCKVYLFDVDDLDGVVAENRGARASEAVRAEAIVEAEVESFWTWLQGLDVVPTIVALRES